MKHLSEGNARGPQQLPLEGPFTATAKSTLLAIQSTLQSSSSNQILLRALIKGFYLLKTVTRFTNLFVGAFCGLGAALFFSFSMFILITSSLVTPLTVSAEEGLPLAGFDSADLTTKMTISMSVVM